MRSKEQILRYIDARVVDREPGGYADVDLPVAEVTSTRLEIDDLPWWVSIHVTDGEDGALHLPASFVPVRTGGEWSVEVEHVIDPGAWPASRPGEDYMDALAAELVDRAPADEGVSFEGVEGPHAAPEGSAVWYRIRVANCTLGDAVRIVRSLDGDVRQALAEKGAGDSELYPVDRAPGEEADS